MILMIGVPFTFSIPSMCQILVKFKKPEPTHESLISLGSMSMGKVQARSPKDCYERMDFVGSYMSVVIIVRRVMDHFYGVSCSDIGHV